MKKITLLILLFTCWIGLGQSALSEYGVDSNTVMYQQRTILEYVALGNCDQTNATPAGGVENGRGCNAANNWTVANDFIVATGQNAVVSSIIGNILIPAGQTVLTADISLWTDAAGVPGAIITTQLGIVPTSQPVIGSAFGFDIRAVAMDPTPLNLPGNSGSPTTYWISVQVVASGGGPAYWEDNSTNVTGQFLAFNGGGGWTIPAARDGVHTFVADCLAFVSVCGSGNPQPIPVTGTGGFPCTGGPTTSPANVAAAGVIGTSGGEYTIDNVTINLTHTWDSDLDITLVSPMGTMLDLSSDNGGSGDNYTNTVFRDGFPSITTGAAPFTGTFQAEGGTFAAAFLGESITGNWTLSICDDAGGDSGTLLSYCITLNQNPGPIGDPPVISCPADQMIDTTGGLCTGVANWADAIALDTEDGPIPTTQTMGPPSGSMFPVGDTIIEYSATDSDGNTSTCQFTITVTDNEAPIAICQDITVELDAAGMYTLLPAEVDNGSSDNCGIVSYEFQGAPTVITTGQVALNMSGNALIDTPVTLVGLSTSGADVTVDLEYQGDFGSASTECFLLNGPDGTQVFLQCATPQCSVQNTNFVVLAATWNNWITTFGNDLTFVLIADPQVNGNLCGGGFPDGYYSLSVNTPGAGLPSLDLTCAEVGPNTVTLLLTDANGNSSTCTSTVTVEDNIAPVIVCIGEPATVVDTTSDSPALAILDNTTVSTMMSVTDDFVITDLDVDLDITHTWVGDLQITLESPAGTQVLIFDGSADGCSGDNIVDRYDDESANALACMTGADAFPLADYMPSNPLAAFDGEGTLGDWIIYIEDTAGGDQGTLNSWTLNYSHDVSGSPLDVVLDASGNVTVNVSSLLMSITEACGWTATTGGGAPVPATLPTTLAGGNGNFGNMFDINALEDVTIDSFDIHGDTGATFDVEVWAKTGTWVGSENTPGDWTLIGTAPGVVSNGDGVVTPLGLSLGYVMNAGETHAFYVTPTDTSTGGFNYTNGTTVGAVFAADANIEFLEGNGNAYPFGTTFQPRIFNGNIQYSVGGVASATIDFDCSNLGLNTVDLTVTDDSGNVATCTATVNVLDETDPIITCVGPTTPILTGTASDSPGTVIVDNATVTTTIEVTDDVTMTDLNVDMNITHTWVGDLQITLESPAGTTVLIFDGGADGCSGDNIYDLYDDESANALACMAGTGDAFPLADYMPSNALSAFDGESTLGTWTLSVQDTAGGDTGTIDSWSLIYTYEGAPLPAYPIYLDENGEYTVDPLELIATIDEACGISTSAADITEFFCSDVGTGIILVTVFVSDASGNIAACVAEVEVFDILPPVVECPADITVDPGPGNLFYEVPDYFASGEATATDNCTDPLTILSQSPAAGTLLPDGVYPVTMTAEDEWGNVGTCTFTLTIESVLGVDENELDVAIIMYPNPAQHQVTISNSSNIQLERATIFDLNGKLISQTNLSTMVGEKTIDVSELAAGVYVVQISSDNASAIKRLIKE